jgi:hypothetical protein
MDIGCEGVDWINLAEDRDQLWAFVKTKINLQIHERQKCCTGFRLSWIRSDYIGLPIHFHV